MGQYGALRLPGGPRGVEDAKVVVRVDGDLAERAGIGVIAKRPIANARLLPADSSHFHGGPHWDPVRQHLLDAGAWDDPLEASLRFTLSHPVIDSAIIGTTTLAHASENARRAAAEPLPPALLDALHNLAPSS